MKILLVCAMMLGAVAVLSLSVGVIKNSMPYVQYSGYELLENSSTNQEFKTVREAFDFVQNKEGNVTITLHDLKYNPDCEGYEYGIFVYGKNMKYVVCQNGNFAIYKPRSFGLDDLRKFSEAMAKEIEKKLGFSE